MHFASKPRFAGAFFRPGQRGLVELGGVWAGRFAMQRFALVHLGERATLFKFAVAHSLAGLA